MNVIDLMNARLAKSSKPQARDDDFKLGLAVEGGGMRGVVSAGMLTALEHLGYTNVFDAVYGSSAGSINCAYFLARQSTYGTSIYYNNANCSSFISWWRAFSKRPPMDLDYLLYHVFTDIKVLDWQAILRSGIGFNILASSLDRDETVLFNTFHDRDGILSALKASACIPWFAGKPVIIDQERFVDASFFESIPYRTAVRDRCTHVLVLRTRPLGAQREGVSILEKFILKKYFSGKDIRHYDYYVNSRSARYNESVRLLESPVVAVDGYDVQIASVAIPQRDGCVSQLEKGKSKLLAGAMSGYNCVLQHFGREDIIPVDVIMPFSKRGQLCGVAGGGTRC